MCLIGKQECLWKKSYNYNFMQLNTCRNLILFFFMTVSTVSCTVKEDRGLCPTSLYLEFDTSNPLCPSSAQLTVLKMEDVIWEDKLDLSSQIGEYCISVPKRSIHVRVWAGADNLDSKDGIHIPLGQDCPKVYMYDSDIDVSGEQVRRQVVMRKNHCIMTVASADESGFSYGIHVTGNVSGYTSFGQPQPGEFQSSLKKKGAADLWEVSLPRQLDESLLLHVSDDTGVLTSFALGHYLASSGYDWTRADLEDVSVTLDYALTQVKVVIDGWESVYTYDMEI